ncbi:PrgH/EprH family type III secretion apparatus protein [Pseudomonas sp. Z3-6]|uniref:PrgH/EprH family type III secretion apparatus protein n=1 Tax=Pseudomonas sp. Z3-6 TaxID=2817411 RepID=UPI003DA9297C
MTVPTAPPLQPCVLRILNGPLQGCEFPLGEGTTLFVVGAVAMWGDGAGAASVPADAIFIPLEEGGCNFEVLADHATPDGVPVRLLGDLVEMRHCAFQARVPLGGLQVWGSTLDARMPHSATGQPTRWWRCHPLA